MTLTVALPRPTYFVMGGIREAPDFNECAVEIGPIASLAEAVSVAESLRGVPARRIIAHNPKASTYDVFEPERLEWPIVGVTIESYDGEDTTWVTDLY